MTVIGKNKAVIIGQKQGIPIYDHNPSIINSDDIKKKRAVKIGNEQKGLSIEQSDACDVVLSLPMQGRVSSLNLAVAAGVLLYQFAG